MARYLAFILAAIGAYAVAYAGAEHHPSSRGVEVWSYTIRSIGTACVGFKSDESVKKLDDMGCMFLP
jgi:hypothetical protein